MKKSKFLSICFGACFGAGQMYLGMQKKGLTIMGGTCSLIMVAVMIHMPSLLFMMPVIWCYALFDALNSFPLTMEERKEKDEKFFIKVGELLRNKEFKIYFDKKHILIGWGCVLYGVYLLSGNFLYTVGDYVGGWFYSSIVWNLYHSLPRILFSIVIIFAGVKLLKRNLNEVTEMGPTMTETIQCETLGGEDGNAANI